MHRLSVLTFGLIFLLLAGCAGIQRLETIRDARRHMLAASQMEASRQLQEAAREYAYVAEVYPDSSFHKTAVFKAAMLSGHPDNPGKNLSASLSWLDQYQQLGLSDKERQSVQFMVALIKQKQQSQAEISRFKTEFQNLKAVVSQRDLKAAAHAKQLQDKKEEVHQLEMKIASYEEQIKAQNDRIAQLQAEIAKAQDALQQLKDVDLQIHRSRTKEAK